MGQVIQNTRGKKPVLEEGLNGVPNPPGQAIGKVRPWVALAFIALAFFVLPSLVSAGTIRKPPTNLGLTAYWPMNENAGTIVGDASGNSRDLKFNGAVPPTWTNGKRGKALNLGGWQVSLLRKDSTTLPAMSTLISTATGTISVWVRPAASGDVPFGDLSSAPPIINDQFGYVGITQADYGADRLWAHNNDGVEDAVGITYTPGEWVHITWMHASSTLYVYKNGELVESTPSGNTQNLTFGVQVGRSVSGTFFNGDIDELRTYNRPLTASEIMRVYQSGAVTIGRTNKSPGTLSSGLQGHWTFDGKDMVNNVVSVTGTNNGRLYGQAATSTTIGAIGQALNFDGVDDYVNLGSASTIAPGANVSFTAALWYKGAGSGTKYFIAGPTTISQGFWSIGESETSFYSNSQSSLGTELSYTLPNDTKWHHIAATLDRGTSPDTVTVYIDGVLYASATEIGGMDGGTAAGTGSIYIGRGNWAASNMYRQGPMDDVRIYNRALSAGEILQLYHMGETKVAKTGTPSGSLHSGLVAHYTFDGKDMYQNVADVSGNGYNGVISGQAATTTVIGKIGQALNFDGTNDYVDLGDRAVFEPSGTQDFSVAFWYKGLKGSTENFISNSPSVANYWSVGNTGAQFCGGNTCGFARVNSYTLPSDNDWHHLAVVLDRSTSPDSLNVYLDGVSVGTQSGALNDNSTTWGTNTRIGAPHWATSGYRQGPMDDVRIYSRALSASEAKQLYLLGK